MQFSRLSVLTREMIFDLWFTLCQIIVSWLQIILSPQKHCLLQTPPFFSLKSILYFVQLSLIPLECVKTAPLVSVFQQSFHLGCQDSVSFVQLNGERREDVVSGLFSCKDLMLCSQQLFEAHVKIRGGRMLFENEFSKPFQFCVSTQWWSTGKEGMTV